jgi:hypothetical protein
MALVYYRCSRRLPVSNHAVATPLGYSAVQLTVGLAVRTSLRCNYLLCPEVSISLLTLMTTIG